MKFLIQLLMVCGSESVDLLSISTRFSLNFLVPFQVSLTSSATPTTPPFSTTATTSLEMSKQLLLVLLDVEKTLF